MEYLPRAIMLIGGVDGPFGAVSFLLMNRNGERFMNEANTAAIPASFYRQPLGRLCLVTDDKWLEQVKLSGVSHGSPDFGRPEYIGQCREDMEEVLGAGAEGYPVRNTSSTERMSAVVYGANSLEELAGYLGYEGENRENWLRTVREYNEMCRRGKDTRFGKDPETLLPIDTPPFYGCISENTRVMVGLVTLSGLVTDNSMNVLNFEDKPICGLYAAGNCLGGRYAVGYPGVVGGNSIGMAMTHGRVLGRLLAGK